MLFDRGHPCFWNINSTFPVDIVRVNTYLNRLFDPASVPVRVRIMINLTSFQSRVVYGVVETAEVWVWASRMSGRVL